MIASQTFQSASLYVGDLHTDATEGLLFEMFSAVGPVASIRICRDAVTRESLGYAYVNFHNVHDAERTLDTMNFTDIKGKPCRIMWSQRDPTLRKSGVGNVFIKNLSTVVDNKSLFDTFSVFGNILSCKVITDEKGASKGFGYVHYETAEAAQDAIKKLDGCQIEGNTVSVMLYSRKAERAGQNEWTNVYVKQFPETWTEERLNGIVTAFGPVTSLVVTKDGEGKSKGFAFINFETHEAAAAAVEELNNKTFEEEGNTATLYASQAQKKSERIRELKKQMDAAKHEKIMKLQGMNLFVKNLDDTINDDMLRELFAPFGTITSARVMFDEAAGNISKGFGFVCYSSAEEANKAMTEMNNKAVQGKPLTVNLHQRKDVRHAQLSASFNNRNGNRNYPMNNSGNNMAPYGMMYNGQQDMRQFNNRGMAGPSYPMPAYGMQGGRGAMRPQGAYFNNNMMPSPGGRGGGRGGPGGRGGRGNMMQQAPGQPGPQGARNPMMNNTNVKFNMQARNQPPMGGGMMPPQQMQMQPPQQMAPQEGMPMQVQPLDEIALAQAEPQMQKHMIGERLYPLIMQHQPAQAGKITGMLLEMDTPEVLNVLEDHNLLMSKVNEAVAVLQQHSGDGN